MNTEPGSIRRFRSELHPGEVPAPVAFGAFLVRPIGATMLPVMIVGVILVAMFSAPNIMHIIITYWVRQRRDQAISQWGG